MKISLFTTIFLLFYFQYSYEQILQPAILSLKGYGGAQDEAVSRNVMAAPDGGFVMCISSNSYPHTGTIDSLCSSDTSRTIFIKYNADASVIEWVKCYKFSPDSNVLFVLPLADGSYITEGGTTSQGGFFFKKYDAADNLVWRKHISKGNMSVGVADFAVAKDGGYILTGDCLYSDTNFTTHYGSWMDPDMWIMKLDSNGNKQWSKVFGGSGYDSPRKLEAASQNGYYIVGITESTDHDCVGNHGQGDGYLVRLDSNGNLLWHKDYGGAGNDGADYAVPDGKGGLYISAATYSSDGDVHHHIQGSNIWALDVDSNGVIIWENCYGYKNEYPNAICRATDGSIWLAGFSDKAGNEVYTSYGGGDAYIVHADSAGNFLSAKVLGGTAFGQDEAFMIYPLPGGRVITGGGFLKNDGAFSSLPFYSSSSMERDAFLAILAPWTTGISTLNNLNGIKIYPNPTKSQVTVEIPTGEAYSLLISDAKGTVVYNDNVRDKKTIATGTWSRGVYYLKFTNSKNTISIYQLLLN